MKEGVTKTSIYCYTLTAAGVREVGEDRGGGDHGGLERRASGKRGGVVMAIKGRIKEGIWSCCAELKVCE